MTAAPPTVVPLSIFVTSPAHSQATTYCPFYITGHVGARSNDVTFLKLNMHEISVFSLCANENFSLRHLLQEVPILLIKARLQGCAVFCVHFYDNGMSCFLSVFPGLFLTSCLLRLFIPVMSVGPLVHRSSTFLNFCPTAPDQPSATGLPCIRPCFLIC